ncbi:hypothetical protein HUT11_10585 [Streptomyces seoulensis]|nr:hypothetical protein HUT11_10585 [Streptomyces seoulensis]
MARVHRTTTATLLVTVAVSALTGCVTVHRTPTSGPGAAPAGQPAPRPEGVTGRGAVQAPAREALGRVGPSPDRGPAPTRGTTDSSAEPRRPAAPAAPSRHPRLPLPRHDYTPYVPRVPHADIPDVGHAVPGNADVCDLGREYGHWSADSPQSRICGQAYR